MNRLFLLEQASATCESQPHVTRVIISCDPHSKTQYIRKKEAKTTSEFLNAKTFALFSDTTSKYYINKFPY